MVADEVRTAGRLFLMPVPVPPAHTSRPLPHFDCARARSRCRSVVEGEKLALEAEQPLFLPAVLTLSPCHLHGSLNLAGSRAYIDDAMPCRGVARSGPLSFRG